MSSFSNYAAYSLVDYGDDYGRMTAGISVHDMSFSHHNNVMVCKETIKFRRTIIQESVAVRE